MIRMSASAKTASKAVRALAFTVDGRTLASGGEDSTVRLWDVAARVAIGRPLTWNDGFVWAFAESGDDRTITVAAGGEVMTWPFSAAGWDAAACRFAGHDLSPTDWSRYAPNHHDPQPLCAR
jgi:WD40 repeat protein